MNLELELIHYGAKSYAPELFKDPINSEHMINKPTGGLWTSPIGAEYGWRDWAEDESYGDLSCHFRVQLVGEVLVIDSLADLDKFPWDEKIAGCNWYTPDFTEVIENYDAIYLTTKGERATRYSDGKSLYGWDCESVLVLNKDSITAL